MIRVKYFILMFIIPLMVYGISWNMYRQGEPSKQNADNLYYFALLAQAVLIVGGFWQYRFL